MPLQLVTGFYCVREHPDEYLAGMTAMEALAKTPNAAVVFQAKTLEAQTFFEKWIPKKPRGYVLLRHRLIAIFEDVITRALAADPLTPCDLTGPSWIPTQVDHMAYGRPRTSRLLKNDANAASASPASFLATGVSRMLGIGLCS